MEIVQEEQNRIRPEDLQASIKVEETVPTSYEAVDKIEHSGRDASKEGRADSKNGQEIRESEEKTVQDNDEKKEKDFISIKPVEDSFTGSGTIAKNSIVTNGFEGGLVAGSKPNNCIDKLTEVASGNQNDRAVDAINAYSGASKAGWNLGDQNLESGLKENVAVKNGIEDRSDCETKNIVSKLDIMEIDDCVHAWQLDDGNRNFNLWPKDRLRCQKCDGIMPYMKTY